MAWTYSQSTGRVSSPAGSSVGIAYSGHGKGLNNPAMQQVPNEGPIPRGDWEIGEFFDDPQPHPPDGKKHHGAMVARLTPLPGTETFGRSGFMIHGDNAEVNHTASEGCVVAPHVVRQMVMTSGDKLLTVVE